MSTALDTQCDGKTECPPQSSVNNMQVMGSHLNSGSFVQYNWHLIPSPKGLLFKDLKITWHSVCPVPCGHMRMGIFMQQDDAVIAVDSVIEQYTYRHTHTHTFCECLFYYLLQCWGTSYW